jgi:hypothetical protein
VIHNFALHRADGTTAAQRLFGRPFPDLFEFIVENMSDLPYPEVPKNLKSLKCRACILSRLKLVAFLSQVLDSDKTCHHAVSRVIAWLAAEDAEIPSEDSSAYCQARKRLPENCYNDYLVK